MVSSTGAVVGEKCSGMSCPMSVLAGCQRPLSALVNVYELRYVLSLTHADKAAWLPNR
jgi:hypothetical protein